MKKKILAMMTAVALVLGMTGLTGCSSDDNAAGDQPADPRVTAMEKSLVGLWYEEFAYEDVTETGKPFSRALIAVEARADHTGYVALAVFDDQFNEPLAIYGGPKDAPFTWQVTADGHVTLTDPSTGQTYSAARRRTIGSTATTRNGSESDGSNSGDHSDFVDIGQIDLNCGTDSITFSNGSHEGTLTKADGGEGDLIDDWMAKSTLPPACITDSFPAEEYPSVTNYRFTYPSVDPYGNPCTLSGVIAVNKQLIEEDKPFIGILLYNHYTANTASELLSYENTVTYKAGGKMNFIAIAPDYYGFGVTASEPQAYCMARANGRASLDAYLAAKRMVDDLGITVDDRFFIGGYSQGAQTTMSVLREISERHPEINVTRAFVGGGPYDMGATYEAIVKRGTKMPSTVCNLLWSYNHYYGLGYDTHDYLKDPVATNFDDWFLSKNYSRKALDEELIKTRNLTDVCTEAVLDSVSPLALRFRDVFSRENLTSGWTPRSDLDIFIVHHEADDVVPVENHYAMVQFLKDHHIKTQEILDWVTSDSKTNHEKAGEKFMLSVFILLLQEYTHSTK